MAVKIYISENAIVIEGLYADKQYINPAHLDWKINKTIYSVRDGIARQDYELGIYSNVQNEAGTPYASDAALETALNGMFNSGVGTGSADWARYTASEELVNAADIGAVDDTYLDVGSEIDCRGYNTVTLFIDFTVSDSTGNQIQVLSKHESAGAQEYVLESAADYQKILGDANIKIAYTFDTTGIPYLQLQSKATDVDTGGGTIATLTIDIIKAY